MNNSGILRTILEDESIYLVPGIFDCLGVKIAQKVGFSVASITGNGIAASFAGLPDMGLISFNEVLVCAKNIANAVSIPIIADIDTGFGNAINVVRTISEFERAGISGVHIEDQVSPKKCAYYGGNRILVSIEEQEKKIAAAVYARVNPDFVIIARTDALREFGIEETIKRLLRYVEAGADAIFVVGITDLIQIQKIKNIIDVPIIININDGNNMSKYSLKELKDAGVKMVMYPATARSSMIKAMENSLSSLLKNGYSDTSTSLATLEEFNDLIELQKYKTIEDMFLT